MSVKVVKGVVVVEGEFSLEQLPQLKAKLTNRSRLELLRVSLPNLEFLDELSGLDDVRIMYSTIGDPSALAGVPGLRSLFINASSFSGGFEFLGQLTALEELDVLNMRGKFAVPALSELTRLTRFRAWGCKGFTEVTPIAAAPRLEHVELVDTGLEPESLMPLLSHETLSSLDAQFGTQATQKKYLTLLAEHGKTRYPL